MDAAITSVLVSAGVSLLLTGSYWFYKKIRAHYKKGKIFRDYKNHLINFLENYQIFLEKETITWGKHSYHPEDLTIEFSAETGNRAEDIKRNHVPAVLFALWAEQDLRNEEETDLFLAVLRKFTPEDHCFFGAKKVDNKNHKIPITRYAVYVKKNAEVLASSCCSAHNSLISCYSTTTLDRIKRHLSQLQNGSYDGRIKKIIANNMGAAELH